MLNLNINFDAISDYQFFHLDLNRTNEMLQSFCDIVSHALGNYNEYISFGVSKKDMIWRVNTGKIFKEVLSVAKTENEQLFALFCADFTIKHVKDVIEKNSVEHEENDSD